MAITELLPRRSRKQVACFGGLPSKADEQALTDHDFRVASCTSADLQNSVYLAGLNAVIFTQNIEKLLQIVPILRSHAKKLLDYDCQVIIRLAPNGRVIIRNVLEDLHLPTAGLTPDEEKLFDTWQPELRGYVRPPHIRLFDVATGWRDIAKVIVANPVGHAPNSELKIAIELSKNKKQQRGLNSCEELLLKRAFWDCAAIHLAPMTDGLSGELVYRAHADQIEGQHGPLSPLPYFVKIGNRNNIFDEYQNYEQKVRPYIPFHLGPRLVTERCCLGASEGIIVGDYVEESESLRDCASNGRAALAIATLFNRTLRGWYRQAHKEQSSLATLLRNFLPEGPPPKGRVTLARALGAKLSLKKMRVLFERFTFAPVLVGPIHGDLHATNVLVRGADAIVIDFYKYSENAPLVYDAACLEAGLLVDGFNKDTRDIDDWLQSIKPLYDNVHLHIEPTHCHPKDPSSWYYACVHQIRLHARQMECCQGQYAAALAVALLKKACKNLKFDKDQETRRATAYVLAEHVLKEASKIFSNNGSTSDHVNA